MITDSDGKEYNVIPGGKATMVKDPNGVLYTARPVKPSTEAKKKDKFPVPHFCQKDLLALVGTAGTMSATPFTSKDFEIWAVAVCYSYEEFKRGDVFFEMHTAGYWKDENVLARLKKMKEPIYMHKKEKIIPASMRFPIEIITEKYREYHTTSISYMLALAYHSFLVTGKPRHVALFGIHMEAREEYTEQRPCCEYWIGIMEGAGIDVEIAPGGALLVSSGLYGYENYNPVCYEFKKRIEELRNGLNFSENERMKAIVQKARQQGGIAETEHWLRKYQRGEIK